MFPRAAMTLIETVIFTAYMAQIFIVPPNHLLMVKNYFSEVTQNKC